MIVLLTPHLGIHIHQQHPSEFALGGVVRARTGIRGGLDADVVARPVVLHLDDIGLPAGTVRLRQDPVSAAVDIELARH